MARNWQKKEYDQLLRKIKEILDESDDLVSTPDLFEQVKGEVHNWKEKYLRHQLLPAALSKLEEDREIEIGDKRHEGGHPTYYWRLIE